MDEVVVRGRGNTRFGTASNRITSLCGNFEAVPAEAMVFLFYRKELDCTSMSFFV